MQFRVAQGLEPLRHLRSIRVLLLLQNLSTVSTGGGLFTGTLTGLRTIWGREPHGSGGRSEQRMFTFLKGGFHTSGSDK